MFRETPGGSGSLLAGGYYLKRKKNQKTFDLQQTIRKLVVSVVHVCTSELVKRSDVKANGQQLHDPICEKKERHTHPLDGGRGGMRLENSKWHSGPITASLEYIFSCLDHSVVTSLAATARSPFNEALLFLHTSVTQRGR